MAAETTDTGTSTGTGTGTDADADMGTVTEGDAGAGGSAARERLGRAQAELLAALVAGASAPDGFDRERLAVQSRALVAKRAGVVAKVAPELPLILGEKTFRTLFHDYARTAPMTGGYRRDALDFAAHVLDEGTAGGLRARRRLRVWWLERSGPAPLPGGRVRRWLRLVLGR
ncbi:hypothetical protein K378_04976 [Streptomyces sp. Amel2xB2]|nr:hypothetical protein K378_04976 [Streptomyces sp. Amel2xB2]